MVVWLVTCLVEFRMQLDQRTAIGEGVAAAGVGLVTRGSDAALAGS
jgi:hypothetical protein